jgi:hypothetical protein
MSVLFFSPAHSPFSCNQFNSDAIGCKTGSAVIPMFPIRTWCECKGIRLENASGVTSSGDPYIRVFLHDGVLNPGQNIDQALLFRRPSSNNGSPGSYSLDLLSGQGQP